MQFWNGSVHIGSHRADEAEMYEHVDGCDYGFYSCQYCNIRYVSVDNKPSGFFCYVCRYGCADPDALCTSDYGSLVARQFTGKGGWYCCTD